METSQSLQSRKSKLPPIVVPPNMDPLEESTSMTSYRHSSQCRHPHLCHLPHNRSARSDFVPYNPNCPAVSSPYLSQETCPRQETRTSASRLRGNVFSRPKQFGDPSIRQNANANSFPKPYSVG